MGVGRLLWENSDLRDDIAFWFRLADMAVMKRIAEALKPFELRPGHYAGLVVIGANPGRKQQMPRTTSSIGTPAWLAR